MTEIKESLTRVLVVDDDKRDREVYVEILRAAGHTVQSAADGGQGLRLFSEWRPDVVLIDMFMPVMDGLKLIMAIRRMSTSVGIVAMSGVWHRSGVMDQALALSVAAALLKPIDADLLRKTVESAARNAKQEPDGSPERSI